MSRRIVELADEAMVVASGSPVGLVRALSTIADIRSITATPIHVVVNRMPQDRFLRAEWTRELTRTFTPVSLTFLPFDRGLSKAAWDAPVRRQLSRQESAGGGRGCNQRPGTRTAKRTTHNGTRHSRVLPNGQDPTRGGPRRSTVPVFRVFRHHKKGRSRDRG